jgi:hypothetical protein
MVFTLAFLLFSLSLSIPLPILCIRIGILARLQHFPASVPDETLVLLQYQLS